MNQNSIQDYRGMIMTSALYSNKSVKCKSLNARFTVYHYFLASYYIHMHRTYLLCAVVKLVKLVKLRFYTVQAHNIYIYTYIHPPFTYTPIYTLLALRIIWTMPPLGTK